MKVSPRIPFFILVLLVLISCTGKQTVIPPTLTSSDSQLALQALEDFLESLQTGRFEEAAQLYGGTYETMVDHNPSIDPADHAALLQNACMINGAQCLEVRSAGLDREVSDTEFIFNVEFQNGDGTLFVSGPCCGGNETDFPPQSEFHFRVVRTSEGKFLVIDMVPYAP
jgi:hypothetical protein